LPGHPTGLTRKEIVSWARLKQRIYLKPHQFMNSRFRYTAGDRWHGNRHGTLEEGEEPIEQEKPTGAAAGDQWWNVRGARSLSLIPGVVTKNKKDTPSQRARRGVVDKK